MRVGYARVSTSDQNPDLHVEHDGKRFELFQPLQAGRDECEPVVA
jgi:DNA invertase Pin-like site-specific DNA recombinase